MVRPDLVPGHSSEQRYGGHPAPGAGPGTAEAARLWREYERLCTDRSEPDIELKFDAKTGGTIAVAPNGEVAAPPSQALGLPALDTLAERVASLYELGDLVSVDRQGRIPPLDIPVRAEWFDVESARQAGAVKREIKLRISALEPRTLREIENKRTNVNSLLQRFSYALGDGLRWMPEGVYPLFFAEMERVNGEGTALLQSAVAGSAAEFIQRQRERIERDANLIYQEFHPGKRIRKAHRYVCCSAGRLVPQTVPGKAAPHCAGNGSALRRTYRCSGKPRHLSLLQ